MTEQLNEKVKDHKVTDEPVDMVNNPIHYQGAYGLEAMDVIDDFIGNLAGKQSWVWGDVMSYILRFQKKNGLEDLQKTYRFLGILIDTVKRESVVNFEFTLDEIIPYQGEYGVDMIDVINNFIWDLVGDQARYWNNTVMFLLQFSKLKDVQSLENAQFNLRRLIKEWEKDADEKSL